MAERRRGPLPGVEGDGGEGRRRLVAVVLLVHVRVHPLQVVEAVEPVRERLDPEEDEKEGEEVPDEAADVMTDVEVELRDLPKASNQMVERNFRYTICWPVSGVWESFHHNLSALHPTILNTPVITRFHYSICVNLRKNMQMPRKENLSINYLPLSVDVPSSA